MSAWWNNTKDQRSWPIETACQGFRQGACAVAMRGIAKHARRCPKALAGCRSGRPCGPPGGVRSACRCPASPAHSFLPGGPHGQSLWAMISGPWYEWAVDGRGNALIEFAFVLPLWLLLSTGMLEVGRGFYQTAQLEKSVRAGALYLARHSFPLSTATLAAAENLVKTGHVDGGDYTVSGWAKTGADLQITSVSNRSPTRPGPLRRGCRPVIKNILRK